MEKWLRSTFEIIPDGWVENDGETTSDAFVFGRVKASVNAFVKHFGAVPVPPTAKALKAVDPDDHLGWHQHFDAWAEQGIIAAE